MKNRIVKILVGRSTEIAIMLFVVVIFFAALTTLLFKIFPAGITLTQILEQRGNRALQGDRTSGGMFSVSRKKENTVEQPAATLSYIGNDVRSKGASSIAWSRAREGMKLRDHDAVQTFSQSAAQINFDRTNYLTMGSNSLVIIKRIEKEPARNERRSTVVVVDGQLLGHVASGGRNLLNLNIDTPSAVVQMQPQVRGGPKSEFKVSVNPDRSSTVVVFRGEADVSAQGKTVRLKENTGVTVKPGEAPPEPTPLPPAPAQTSPADGMVVRYRELPERIPFAWRSGNPGSGYHVQVARDAGFKELLVDRRLDEAEFVHGNLKKGKYYWRVSRIDAGIEGFMSKGSHFEVVQNLNAPRLEVNFPSEPVPAGRVTISGSSDPGTRLFVDGKAVPTDQGGTFSCQIQTKRGWNLVTVEAVDALGNISYRSRYVQGRF